MFYVEIWNDNETWVRFYGTPDKDDALGWGYEVAEMNAFTRIISERNGKRKLIKFYYFLNVQQENTK